MIKTTYFLIILLLLATPMRAQDVPTPIDPPTTGNPDPRPGNPDPFPTDLFDRLGDSISDEWDDA
ncbi:MAG: hypothetical protein NXH75_15695, partial [Halobacteriovoraceae bacterium]|nr:hypothetical protein [Halobacteriovoraceae bacterium]